MTFEIGRRLITGVWRTGVAEEGGNGGSSAVAQEVTDLDHTDILGLGTTPIAVVPSPGAGKCNLPIYWALWTNFTVAYTGAKLWLLDDPNWYDNVSPWEIPAVAWQGAAENYYVPAQAVRQINFASGSHTAAIATYLGADGPISDGDPANTMRVIVVYSTFDVP